MIAAPENSSAHKRWWVWLPLLCVGAWLALFGDKTPAGNGAAVSVPTRALPQPVVSERVPTRVETRTVTPGNSNVEELQPLVARDELIAKAPVPSGDGQAAARDLFSTHNWNPPPPPAPVVVPAPVAPALPFSFLGKKLESEAWEVYLARGEQTFIVREGQVLDGTYRIDKIEPPTIAMTYLPLGQVQTLPIGDSR